jgi:hypothetical protein
VADGSDPGCAVHFESNDAGGGRRRLTGVYAHSYAYVFPGGPFVFGQDPLYLDGCGHGSACGSKGREEGIALRSVFDSVVGLESGSDDSVVVG